MMENQFGKGNLVANLLEILPKLKRQSADVHESNTIQ